MMMRLKPLFLTRQIIQPMVLRQVGPAGLVYPQMRDFRTTTALFAKQKSDDLYDTLGVTSAASDKEIKRAFLQKAKQYHPDINRSTEAPKMFSQINEAYETLSDLKRRKVYDKTGMTSNE